MVKTLLQIIITKQYLGNMSLVIGKSYGLLNTYHKHFVKYVDQ